MIGRLLALREEGGEGESTGGSGSGGGGSSSSKPAPLSSSSSSSDPFAHPCLGPYLMLPDRGFAETTRETPLMAAVLKEEAASVLALLEVCSVYVMCERERGGGGELCVWL